jgi:group II intron reverse transcriptase/maturase/CRISPR-associated endonuclease Cas1
LRAAWTKVLANAGAAGGDGVTVERFALVADAQLELLQRELRNGKYRPGPARRVYIPKPNGGVRPPDIPCVCDRIVQGAATLVLTPVLEPEMEDASFAYRKGRSVAQAVARIASLRRDGYTHVVDGDIERYFETIPHDRLVARLERHVHDARMIDLVWLWLEAYSPSGRGVPQGSPISPLLANIYLDDVDERIEGHGIRLVRFADDFVLLCKSSHAAEGALSRIETLLKDAGLELNRDKTRIVDFDKGFRFLGHLFVRSLVVKEVDVDDTPDPDEIAAARTIAQDHDADAAAAFPDPFAADTRLARRLYPVYVINPDHRLDARGKRLAVIDDQQRVVELPPAPIGRIELGPHTGATLEGLDLAAAHGIDLVRVNGHGETIARYEAPGHQRAKVHLAQAAAVIDPVQRETLARLIVDGRIRNQRALLRRLNRERKDGRIAAACVALTRVGRKLDIAKGVAQIMGHEGEAAALYWPALGLAAPADAGFETRTRGPARDAVNACISVLSSMLSRDIRAMALRAGLHPGFGALHSVADGHDALVLDLIEEFRAPVAEACTLAAFNRHALEPQMFPLQDGAATVDRKAWATLIRCYEAWLVRPITSPRSGQKILWRSLMLEQSYAYADHCEGGAPYRPYVMDH